MEEEKKTVNNKDEVPFSYYTEKFAQIKPSDVTLRTAIPFNEEGKYFPVRLLSENYRVYWPELMVEKEDGENVPISVKILLARFLISGAYENVEGDFITYHDIPWGETYYRQFTGRCITRLAYSYSNKTELFSRMMEDIGSVKTKSGDCGYTFEFINGIYMSFILWVADEEFPPSAQILFSPNFPLAFSAEDAAVAAETVLGILKKKAAKY